MQSAAEVMPKAETSVDFVAIRSKRFGNYEVPKSSIIEIVGGMIGLPRSRRYVIMDHQPESPFKWMLSIDEPELGFAVADPTELVQDYRLPPSVIDRLAGEGAEAVSLDQLAVLVVVKITPNPLDITINLYAPIVVDLTSRRGWQVILDDTKYACDHPLIAGATPVVE